MIRVLTKGYVNVFLIGEKEYVLVDTGTKSSGKKILNKLYQLNIKPEEISLIILTHSHEDHIGSLKMLSKATKAQTLIHEIEYKTMTMEIEDGIKPIAGWLKIVYKLTKGFSMKQKPIDFDFNVLCEEEYDLNSFGINGKVIHTPGHSKGSISVVIGNEAIIGDSLMAFIPKSKPKEPIIAYDLQKVKQSIEKLLDMGVTRFYLSHGKSYDANVIRKAIEKI